MGGRALQKYNIQTERKSTKDFLRIAKTITSAVNQALGIETHIVKCYHTKETHGDLDLLLKIDHEFHNKGINLKNWIQETFKPNAIHNNGGVYSFDYDNFQVDFIPVKESNWEVSKCFFDYDPTGNLMGKIAHKFGLKYGFEGLSYPFRNFNGRISKDIVISKNNREIFKFLGYDYDEYLDGFSTVEQIFDWIINGDYFNADNFQMENLNHIDRKRNRKRQTYQGFLEYINERGIRGGFKFLKDKSGYINHIQAAFPECKLTEEIQRLTDRDAENKELCEKFNGRLLMERYPELKGKALGDAITKFKGMFSVDSFREYALNMTQQEILSDFDHYYKTGQL
jgi:hypothetical protein